MSQFSLHAHNSVSTPGLYGDNARILTYSSEVHLPSAVLFRVRELPVGQIPFQKFDPVPRIAGKTHRKVAL